MKIKIIIIYKGKSGHFFAQIDPGTDDKTVRQISLNAVRAGNVPGIDSNLPKRAFRKFTVDRVHDDEEILFVLKAKRSKRNPTFYCPFLHDRFFKTSKDPRLWPENADQIRDDLHYHF